MPQRRRIADEIVALLLTPDNVEPAWSSVAYRIAWQVQLQQQQQQQQRLDRLTVNFRRLLPLARLKRFLQSESWAKNISRNGCGSCVRDPPLQHVAKMSGELRDWRLATLSCSTAYINFKYFIVSRFIKSS